MFRQLQSRSILHSLSNQIAKLAKGVQSRMEKELLGAFQLIRKIMLFKRLGLLSWSKRKSLRTILKILMKTRTHEKLRSKEMPPRNLWPLMTSMRMTPRCQKCRLSLTKSWWMMHISRLTNKTQKILLMSFLKRFLQTRPPNLKLCPLCRIQI